MEFYFSIYLFYVTFKISVIFVGYGKQKLKTSHPLLTGNIIIIIN